MCLKKVHLFYFCYYSVKCWPILTIFGSIAAEKNSQTNDLFLCYNIQFMYESYAVEKHCRDILHAFNDVASSCRRASFLQLFQKFVLYPQSPTFIQEFTNKFSCSIITCPNCHISVCSKFSQLCFCKILFELVCSWESYHKNKKGELFIETQCSYRQRWALDMKAT